MKSVANLLARNLNTIKRAFEVLTTEESFDEFVEANEEILRTTPEIDLKDLLDGMPISIFGSSETRSRLYSLQYAYLLTRRAEKAASENCIEVSLMVLAEACYYAGFAEGQVIAHERQSGYIDRTFQASDAATTRHSRQSDPVKRRFLELLEAESRPEKWKTLAAAFRKFEKELTQFLSENSITLKPENLQTTISGWQKTDSDFRKKLCEFIAIEVAKPRTDKTDKA